jgi:hypothetical protein
MERLSSSQWSAVKLSVWSVCVNNGGQTLQLQPWLWWCWTVSRAVLAVQIPILLINNNDTHVICDASEVTCVFKGPPWWKSQLSASRPYLSPALPLIPLSPSQGYVQLIETLLLI